MKKIRILLTVALAFSIVLGACARKKTFPKAPAYEGSPNNEFPIVASYAFYPPYITEQQFRWVREAGFNIIRKSLEYNQIDECLRLGAANGVYVMICPWNIQDVNKAQETVNRYRNNPYAWGYGVGDEPNATQFEKLGTVVERLRRLDPSKNSTVNLLPAVEPAQLKAPSYGDYLDEYVDRVNTAFLSFDLYPVRYDKNGNIYVEDLYYTTLEEVASVAKKSNRPFWSYVLSVKHWFYPKPQESHIRFQVFSALAYGAQGIDYFTYLMPDFDKDKGEFSYAPIDWNGNRTETWYMVKNVNQEVHNLTSVFLGAEVSSVKLTGKKIPSGATRMKKAEAPLTSLTSDGDGLIVSRLKNNGKEYLLLVNRNVEKSQKVTMTCSVPLTRLYGNGTQSRYQGSSFTLEAGGYALFQL